MIRPWVYGPRSLIRTTTLRPFRWFLTRTFVPIGSRRCAAVSRPGRDISPLAVFPPRYEYTDAIPCSTANALPPPNHHATPNAATDKHILSITPIPRIVPATQQTSREEVPGSRMSPLGNLNQKIFLRALPHSRAIVVPAFDASARLQA